MSNGLNTLTPEIISSIVINGDLSKLTPAQKVDYYGYRCQQADLDPAAKPFDLLTLNGKQVLYANASCTQQLTQNRKLSHQVTNRELVDGIYCVFVRVTGPDGRSTENMGAVPVDNLKGESKANAMLKATTKAIRRAVLAHCGLGMMDESEVDTIPGVQIAPLPALEPKIIEPVEWADEDKESAKAMLNDLRDDLLKRGVSEEDLKNKFPKITEYEHAIGDTELSYNTWTSRVMSYSARILKKLDDESAKPVDVPPELMAHDA